MIKFYHPDLVDGLGNAHYTTILNADINVLNNRIWDDFEDYINHFVLGIDENVSEDINAVEDIIERLVNTNIELAIAVLDKEKVSWDKLDECCENNVEKEKRKKYGIIYLRIAVFLPLGRISNHIIMNLVLPLKCQSGLMKTVVTL